MDGLSVLAIVMRWLHILAATLAVGVPVFMRFVLMPAATATLDDATHKQLRERIMARWRIWVMVLIAVFLISGLYTFFAVARWKDMSDRYKGLYHMLFGIKVLAAFGIFFLASALAGRSAALEVIRQKRKFWLNVNIVLAIVVIICGGVMRFLPEREIEARQQIEHTGSDIQKGLNGVLGR